MRIKISNISKSFEKNIILDNISYEFESGKIYGIIGKNGSGKTMMIRAICGLIILDSGIIEIDDKILGKDISFPDSIGVLIESPGYLGEYSGFDNLKLISEIKSIIDDKDIEAIMEYFDLEPKDNKRVRKYSLGMKQKLGLCVALMEDPDLIILDEPFNALDETSGKKLLDYLYNKKQEGKLIIIASHDIEELKELSDEIVEIKSGRIVNGE